MSLPRYPAYKDSDAKWLGAVPSTWNVRRAKFLFEIKKRIAGVDGHDILSITQQGIKVKDIESNDGQLSMDYSKYQIVEVGDFAMNHMDLLTGYVDVAKSAGVTSPDYRVFSIRDVKICDPKYFLYLFQNGYKQKIFYAFGQGASQLGRWRLPTEQFNDFILPLPPLREQQEIAAFLERETVKIDALISEQEKLITLLAEKRQATISHAVTKGLNPNAPMKDSGVEWLGEVPETWKVIQLKHLCTLVKDGTHLPPARVENGIPLMSVRNIIDSEFCTRDDDSFISEGSYKELCRAFVPAVGDVILACVGATLGKSAIIREGLGAFHIQRSVALFRPISALSSEWLHFCFLSGGFQRLLWEYVGFSAQPGIYLGTLAQFKIAVPEFNEQKNIVEFIQQETMRLDALVAKATRGIALLKERRSALISAAVTGKIDVRQLPLRQSVTIQEAA